MPDLREPIDRELWLRLRLAVVDHVRSLSGRAFPPVVHVGTPGAVVRRFTVDRHDHTDPALRADLVAAMLGRRRRPLGVSPVAHEVPWLWLTRTGRLDEVNDLDAQWLGAACTAYAEAGLDLTMVVVNRRGWRDPRTGVGHTWVRVRP